ncbi:MAG: dockerin type I domain-containing protein [Clostridia bacterium]|nr:dockerin type I domain-containing protein [Clostridia bacterium]
MKHRIAALVCAGLLAASPAFSVGTLAAPQTGDLNGDGHLDSCDMRALLLAENETDNADPAADLNGNGKVNAADEVFLWNRILAQYRAALPTDTATETTTATATTTATEAETTTTKTPTTTPTETPA